MPPQDVNNKIEELKQEIEKISKDFILVQKENEILKNDISSLKQVSQTHRHNGNDNSAYLNQDIILPDQSIVEIGNAGFGAFTKYPGLSSEVNYLFLLAGKDHEKSFGETSDNTQIIIEHQPATTGGTNQTFFWGARPPLYIKSGISITSGTNTLSDTTKTWTTNILTGAYVSVYDSTSVLKETRIISSNTATQITVDVNWTFTDSNSTYMIFMPVYFGAADSPWRRLYTATDIRFGRGTSTGTEVCFIKHGTGTPEGAVTAQVGSLFLRLDGGAGTTLYVKQSGTGNTGWVGK